jgi:hypothetical protein
MSRREFSAVLEGLCSDAAGDVRDAVNRVSRSLKKDEPPTRSDLAIVLLHVVEISVAGRSRQLAVVVPPPPLQPPPVVRRQEPIGRPSRSPFADRIREQEGGAAEETEDRDVRRRFGVSSDEHGRRRRQEEG